MEQKPEIQELAVSGQKDQNSTARIEVIRTYFQKVDAGDPSVLDLFTESNRTVIIAGYLPLPDPIICI